MTDNILCVQEKIKNVKLRSALAKLNNTLTSTMRHIQSVAAKNILVTDAQIILIEQYNGVVLNMTCFVANAETM